MARDAEVWRDRDEARQALVAREPVPPPPSPSRNPTPRGDDFNLYFDCGGRR
jgi:hypothetical protein